MGVSVGFEESKHRFSLCQIAVHYLFTPISFHPMFISPHILIFQMRLRIITTVTQFQSERQGSIIMNKEILNKQY